MKALAIHGSARKNDSDPLAIEDSRKTRKQLIGIDRLMQTDQDRSHSRGWALGKGLGHCFLLSLASALLAFAAFPVSASAEPAEARTYLDIGANGSLAPKLAPDLSLGPFVREESHFREDGLTFIKATAGARMTVLPWLRGAAYYAHKDFQNSDRQQAHMAVVDVFLDNHVGSLVMFDKSGFEAHVTDEFFRYRNAFELRWKSPIGWLAPFARGELRVDSDASRVNQLDGWTGLLLRLPDGNHSPLSLRLFYGYEANRRGQPDWVGVNLLGLELAARL